MSRQIPAKNSLSISEKEAAECDTIQGKILFTTYRGHDCAFLIRKDRLTAVRVLSGTSSKIGAVYIGKIKNMVKNIGACFVEIGDREICFLSLKKAVFPCLLNRPYDGRLVEGDTLLVQVEQDAQKTKQASVTAHISLSNDCFVIAMGAKRIGYSTKLGKEKREALRKRTEDLFTEGVIARNGELIQDWNNLLSASSAERLAADSIFTNLLPLPPTGCIVRTKAADEAEPLQESFFALMEEYARLLHTARYRSCYSCLKKAPGAVETAIQELAEEHEYQEIVTDNEKLYQSLQEYRDTHKDSRPLRFYQDDLLTLSKLYAIESKMAGALESRVWLKSGGYLVIEPTEALTVIDVNSGKYEARKGNEEAVLAVNLEAAREVALQLRLRNLSGIIIVDFINMSQETSRAQVMALLKHLADRDRVRTSIVDMTPLGLVEITRKKTSKPLREQLR
ncbi:MAG: ribonuclease E/G [Eubacterium sp.]|nr:ribonuclease E/G [Eubacterium sp.]